MSNELVAIEPQNALTFFTEKDQAKRIVLAIHNKQIKNVSINY